MNGKERNLAFYRDGDFFGELSILNGSKRAASVEAFTDCRALALKPDAVLDLKRHYPEFEKLLEERLAQYEAKTEARVPLDFTTELLPAEAAAHDKLALDGAAARRGAGGKRRARSPMRKATSGRSRAGSSASSTCGRSMRWIAARPASA